MVSLVGLLEDQRGAGAGFVPFMRILNGAQGPRIAGAEETEMLLGHCALCDVSTWYRTVELHLGRFDELVDPTTLCRIRHVHTNTPKQILLIRRTPVHIRVMSEASGDILLPYIRALRPIRALGSCNEARRSPTTQSTAMRKLIVDEVEEPRIVLVLHNLAAPG